MIREPYNLNPYNSTIDTSKVNNFSFTFSGDELGSWNIEIAKNNTSPEIVYTSEEFVPEDVGYTHIYDDDIVEGITLPSTIAHSQGDDGLLRRLYSINGYPLNAAVVKLNVNGIENIGSIKGSTANGYLVATNYSLGRAGSNVTITGFDKDGTTIGSQVTDGTYDFLGYLLSVKANSNIQVGQAVQIEGNSFIIGSIADAGDGYSELTIVNGEATISDVTPILTFDSLAEADVTELTVGIEPVQDLNGYDKPWVGGAGKNLYAESPNFTGYANIARWALQSETYDGNPVVKSTSAYYGLYKNIYLGVGTYTFSCMVKTDDSSSVAIYSISNNVEGHAIVDTTTKYTATSTSWTRASITFSVTTAGYVSCRVERPSSGDIYLSEYQIELGSTAPTSYSPYSNICPITGHDEVTVTDVGKNRLGKSSTNVGSITVSGLTFTFEDDGSVTLNGTLTETIYPTLWSGNNRSVAQSASWVADSQSLALPSGNYYWSARRSGTCSRVPIMVLGIKTLGTSTGTVQYADTSVTIDGETQALSHVYVGVRAGDVYSNYNIKWQLELGTTATSYEPYRSNTYTTSLGQTVYGGPLDLVSGVLTVDRAEYKLSDMTATIESNNRWFFTSLQSVIKIPSSTSVATTTISDRFVAMSNVEMANTTNIGLSVNGQGNLIVRNGSSTDQPTGQIVIPLATPVEYQLTAQQIKTLVGTNNVWASSGDIVNITFKYNIN